MEGVNFPCPLGTLPFWHLNMFTNLEAVRTPLFREFYRGSMCTHMYTQLIKSLAISDCFKLCQGWLHVAQHKIINLLKTFFCSSVFISVCVFNVWPKTTLHLPVWPRDTKRLDTTTGPSASPEVGGVGVAWQFQSSNHMVGSSGNWPWSEAV